MPRIKLVLFGEIPSKKNRYRAVVRKAGKHKGKAALVKDDKLTGKLNYIMQQIDREVWDLKLLHPTITMQMFCPIARFNQDRDGVITTLLDLLVKAAIIENDDMHHNNGRIVIEPTIESDEIKTVLTLETPDA